MKMMKSVESVEHTVNDEKFSDLKSIKTANLKTK